MRTFQVLVLSIIVLNNAVFSFSKKDVNEPLKRSRVLELLSKNYKFIKMNPGKFKMGADKGDGFEPRRCIVYSPAAGDPRPRVADCPDDNHLIDSAHPQHEVEISQTFEIADAPLGPEIIEALVKHKHLYPDSTKCQSITFNEAEKVAAEISKLDPKFNYRLPTEAEWEYSARCETTDDKLTTTFDGSFPPFSQHELKGVNHDLQGQWAPAYYGWNEDVKVGPYGAISDSIYQGPARWYSGLGGKLKVKSRHDSPNSGEGIQNNCGFKGLRAGNALQWTSDWFDKDYYKTNTVWKDPKGPKSGHTRVLRGGYIDRFEHFAYASMATWARFNPERLGCTKADPYEKPKYYPTKPVKIPCQDEEGIKSVTALLRLVRVSK